MGVTKIAWADKTWNPYTWNCNKVSEGCAHCYAETLAERFRGGNFAGAPSWRTDALREFKKLKAGDIVFVNSISDTFHEGVGLRILLRLFTLIESRPDVQFLVLTKRVERAWYMRHLLPWTKNLWLGASVEMRKYLYRLEYLLDIPAAGHFVSVEPLLESIISTGDFPAWSDGIDRYLYRDYVVSEHLYPLQNRVVRYRENTLKWVIVGGESGVNYRKFDKRWAIEIRDACEYLHVPFMFKQGSAVRSGQDTLLEGQEWMQIPEFQLSSSTSAGGTAPDNALTQMTMFT